MKQYLLIKFRKNYILIDTLPIEMNISFRGEGCRFHITKSNKVYRVDSYEIVDDWYADTGYLTHFEDSKHYIGRLIMQSDNIEEIALEYALCKSKERKHKEN